jgi:hypothetical protein
MIEIAHDGDASGIRRPHGEVGPADILLLRQAGSQHPINPPIPAFIEQDKVFLEDEWRIRLIQSGA